MRGERPVRTDSVLIRLLAWEICDFAQPSMFQVGQCGLFNSHVGKKLLSGMKCFRVLPRLRSNIKSGKSGRKWFKAGEGEVRGYTIHYWPSVCICITQEWQLKRRSSINPTLRIYTPVSWLNTAETMIGFDSFPNTHVNCSITI